MTMSTVLEQSACTALESDHGIPHTTAGTASVPTPPLTQTHGDHAEGRSKITGALFVTTRPLGVRESTRDGSRQVFMCPVPGCGVTLASRDTLREHMYRHNGVRPFVCGVPGCGASFTHRGAISRHRKTVHADKWTHKCPHAGCTRTFITASDVADHVKHRHTGGAKPFVCAHCDRVFKSKSILVEHVRVHTGERPFACPRPGCGKRFKQSGDLTHHIRTHDGIRRYPCPIPGCSKSFAVRIHLEGHLNVHNGVRPFACELCDKAFTLKSFLRRHVRIKHRVPPSPPRTVRDIENVSIPT